jgi:hypothetical protein
MKGTTVKRWIVVGFAVAAVIAFAVFSGPSKPLFSVRVIRYTPGDTNAVLEIDPKFRVECFFWLPAGSFSRTLEPYRRNLISIPITKGRNKADEILIRGGRIVEGSWLRRLARVLKRVGIDLHRCAEISISVTNTTGWMHSREIRDER